MRRSSVQVSETCPSEPKNRNALGEQVASGVYFYQLETDAMSTMRKMLIF